ncbi:MAG TPA: hypothetical protein PLC40_10645 [Candidatus Hydrogenedentes bacterium]|nr:hypothetical protein [Candidatus Hydrogenedentota bacterium]
MNPTPHPPMDTERQIKHFEKQRGMIVQQMLDIRSMAKGKITEQFLEVIRKGESSPAHCGPYYSIVCWNADKGKTQSKRLKTSEELERAKQDIENYQRFELLCKTYVQTTQQLSDAERSAGVTTQEKKRKSCSRKIRK